MYLRKKKSVYDTLYDTMKKKRKVIRKRAVISVTLGVEALNFIKERSTNRDRSVLVEESILEYKRNRETPSKLKAIYLSEKRSLIKQMAELDKKIDLTEDMITGAFSEEGWAEKPEKESKILEQ